MNVREGVINIPGEVYQFVAPGHRILPPPHFRPITSRHPKKSVTQCTPSPKSPSQEKIFRGKFSEPPPHKKKQNIRKFTL